MNDPTWNLDKIKENPVWFAAYLISEHLNDNAPIGWSRYIPIGESLANNCLISREVVS